MTAILELLADGRPVRVGQSHTLVRLNHEKKQHTLIVTKTTDLIIYAYTVFYT